MEQSDSDRFVPDIGPFPAPRVNVPQPMRVHRSTTTKVWIGIAWVLGALALLGIAFLALIVATAPRP